MFISRRDIGCDLENLYDCKYIFNFAVCEYIFNFAQNYNRVSFM